MLVASLIAAAWLAVGRPVPARSDAWFELAQVGESHYSGTFDRPLFFIVVGSDARAGGPGGSRGDSLHVVGINPALGAGTIIGIPRDTAVPIPGRGTDKINAALQYGGLPLQADTVSQLVGIDVPYAIVTDFAGMTAMVDEIGGIDINIPQNLNDPDSGASFVAGPQHIAGHQALAFARDRKDFANGDVSRSENQGLLMLAALGTIRGRMLTAAQAGNESAEVMRMLAILGRHTELDGVTILELYRFARVGLTVDPAAIRNVVIPTGGGAGSNLSVGPGAAGLFADFADDAVLQSH